MAMLEFATREKYDLFLGFVKGFHGVARIWRRKSGIRNRKSEINCPWPV
jgi:hypothetical protein